MDTHYNEQPKKIVLRFITMGVFVIRYYLIKGLGYAKPHAHRANGSVLLVARLTADRAPRISCLRK